MKFEWDPAKNAETLSRRGLDFGYAIRIFDGPVILMVDDRKAYGEARLKALGQIETNVLMVVFTVRGDSVRIISARRASGKERLLWHSRK